MTKIEDLLVEIKASMHKYDDLGMISTPSVYRWAENALKRFGGTIAIPTEAVIEAKNKQAILPKGFFDLTAAYRIDPDVCEVDKKDEKYIPELQHEFAWVERSERGFKWCSCDECCKEEYENTIVERMYIKGVDVRFHYKRRPEKLKKAGSFVKDNCLDKHRSKFYNENPNEVTINGDRMYTSFNGFIYIKYRSVPMDEDGLPAIPDTPLGYLLQYVEAYIKKQIVWDAIVNGDAPNAAEIYKVLAQEEVSLFSLAERECKMMHVTPAFFEEIKKNNRRRISVYERMTPAINQEIRFV